MSEIPSHIPVLIPQVMELLKPQSGQIILDCTLGGGGHSKIILEKISPGGKLIGMDRDPYAINRAKENLSAWKDHVTFYHSDFSQMERFISDDDFKKIAAALIDCGVSSFQLDIKERGFSFRSEAPLDMRMNPELAITARVFLHQSTEEEIANVIYEYGEERNSRRIAKNIVTFRRNGRMETTLDLAEAVLASFPPRNYWKIHPATRTFQAVRMEVNAELDEINRGIQILLDKLTKSAKIVVITFHSLEDRLVKNIFRNALKDKKIKLLNKKPLVADREEIHQNPRSRSAKVRGIEIL